MPIYSYICRNHKEPKIFEVQQKINDELSAEINCSSCNKKAPRLYQGQSIAGANGPTAGGKKMWRRQQRLPSPQT